MATEKKEIKVAAETKAVKATTTNKKAPAKKQEAVLALHKLSPNKGSKTTAKRLGRGISSGLGKTSGKGSKGQNARSGGGVRIGFEGGQNRLSRRLPKRGFTSNFRKIYSTVNVEDFNDMKAKVIDEVALVEAGIIGKCEPYGLKVLGNGELKKAVTVKCAKITNQAKEKIEKAGGKVEIILSKTATK